MSRNFVTTIGSITLDVVLYTDKGRVINTPSDLLSQKLLAFEYGAKTECQRMYMTGGGAAANTAVTFARMGLNPMVYGAVGDDTAGAISLEHLKAERIATKLIRKIPAIPTSVSVILNSERTKGHSIFVYRGASNALPCTAGDIGKIKTPWVYLGSLAGSWRGKLHRIFEQAEKRSISVAWNPGSTQITVGARALRPYLKKSALVLVNKDEAIELLLRSGVSIANENPRTLISQLHEYGQKITVLTMGHQGALLRSGSTTSFQHARKVSFVNKTGAGDAFGSGLLAGILMFRDLRRALRLAVYNSSSVVSHIGAQSGILNRADIKRLKL